MDRYATADLTCLFVYGTLRTGEPLHHVLRGSLVFKERLILKGFAMYDDGRGYPLVVEGDKGDCVEGELLFLKDPDGSILERIDRLEGAEEKIPLKSRLYRRERVEVKRGTYAWLYVYNEPLDARAVMIRDWVTRKRKG